MLDMYKICFMLCFGWTAFPKVTYTYQYPYQYFLTAILLSNFQHVTSSDGECVYVFLMDS